MMSCPPALTFVYEKFNLLKSLYTHLHPYGSSWEAMYSGGIYGDRLTNNEFYIRY